MERKINTCLTLIIVLLSLLNGINAIDIKQLEALQDIFSKVEFKEEYFSERDRIFEENFEGNSLVTLKDNLNVTKLELGGKLVSGNINESICQLKGLEVLDLSDNNLSGDENNYGQLPECLNFLNLKIIKINNNKFKGKMPEFQSQLIEECDIGGLQLCVYADLKIPKKCISDSYDRNEVPIDTREGILIRNNDFLEICTSNFRRKSPKENKIESTNWKIIISSSIFPLCSVVITSGVTLYGRVKSKFNKRNTMMTTFTASISHLPNNFANVSNTNNRQSLLATRYDSFNRPEPIPVNESQNSSEPKDNSSIASSSTDNSNKETQNPTKPSPILTSSELRNPTKPSPILTSSELRNPTKPSPVFSPSEFKNHNYRSINTGNYTQNVRFKNAASPAQNRFSINSGIINNENIVIPVATPSVASSLPVIRENIDESVGENVNETINKNENENGNRNENEIGIEIGNENENEIEIENGNEYINENRTVNGNRNEIGNGNRNGNGNENHINTSEKNDDVKSVVSDVRSNVSTPSKAKESLTMLINSPEMKYLRNVSPILQSKQGLMLDRSPLLPPKSFPSVSPKIKSPKDKSKSPLIMSPPSNKDNYINISQSSQSRGTINISNSQSSQSKGYINSSQSTQNRLSINRPIRNRPRIRRVVYSFTADLPDEISLTPGQEVVIYNLFDDGYAYGKNITNGKKGVFPIDSLHPDDQEITQDDLETSSIISDLQISQLIKSPNAMSPLANVTGSSSQYMRSPNAMSPLANITSSSSQYMRSPNVAVSPISPSQYSSIKLPDMTTSFLINNASSSDGIGKLNINRYSFDIGQYSPNSYSQDSISQGSLSHNSNNSYIGEDDIDSLRMQSKVGYTAYIDQQKQKMMQKQAQQVKKQKLKQKNKNNYEYYQEQTFSPTFSNNMIINNNVNNNKVVDGNVLQQSYQLRQNQNQFPVNKVKATSSNVSYPKSSKNRPPTNNNDVDSPMEMETEERRQRQIQLLVENLNRKDIGPEERRYYLQLLKQLKH